MTLTATQIGFVIVAAALNIVFLLWFRRSEAAASARRMMAMTMRIGLNLGAAARRNPQTQVVLSESRQRCRKCPREDLCDRWLAGEVEGDNVFCANAQTFRDLAKANAPNGWPAAVRPS